MIKIPAVSIFAEGKIVIGATPLTGGNVVVVVTGGIVVEVTGGIVVEVTGGIVVEVTGGSVVVVGASVVVVTAHAGAEQLCEVAGFNTAEQNESATVTALFFLQTTDLD